jgi:RNA polymerase sigma-70 factor (ECF subfamily)
MARITDIVRTFENEENFEELVKEHYRALYRFAFTLAGIESEASDLTQQTFCIWGEKGHQLRDGAKAKAWLFTTLNREFLKGKRRLASFPEREFDEELGDMPDLSPEVVRDLDSRLIVKALGLLDSAYRTPLALFYLEDHSYREIASILEIPIGTVKSRIARGKGLLEKSLSKEHMGLVMNNG